MPNQSSPSSTSILKRLKKAAPNLTLSLQDKNKSRTNVSFTTTNTFTTTNAFTTTTTRPQGGYDGSLEESRRATIALNLMLASLRNEGRSPGHNTHNGTNGYF